MRSVADTEQAFAVPDRHPAEHYVEQPDVVEGLQQLDAISQPRHDATEPLPEGLNAFITKRRDGTLPDHEADLEIVPTVDHDHQVGPRDTASDPLRIGRNTGQPKPQHIHRNTECPQPQPRLLADHGGSPVAPDDKIGLQSMTLAILAVAHANNAWTVPYHIGRLSLHDQLVVGLPTASVGDHIQEIPLRNQGNVLMASAQPAQVGDTICAGIQLDTELLHPTRGQSSELLPESQLVQQDQS